MKSRSVRRRRGLVALIGIAVLCAIALAPIAVPSFVAVLLPLPILFGLVVSERVERVESAPFQSLARFAPLPSRAPPAA